MSTIWDEFQATSDANGEFPERFKFDQPGAAIAGTITHLKVADFGGGDRAPELYIATAEGTTLSVTAGQAQLRAKLAAIRPGVGDGIAITFTHLENRGGGKTLKHFTIDHNPANGATGSPAVAPAPASATVPAAVAPQPANGATGSPAVAPAPASATVPAAVAPQPAGQGGNAQPAAADLV